MKTHISHLSDVGCVRGERGNGEADCVVFSDPSVGEVVVGALRHFSARILHSTPTANGISVGHTLTTRRMSPAVLHWNSEELTGCEGIQHISVDLQLRDSVSEGGGQLSGFQLQERTRGGGRR